MHNDAMDSMAYAMQQLRDAANSMGISVAQAADELRNFALGAQEVKVMFEKSKYKTLNYKHEIL